MIVWKETSVEVHLLQPERVRCGQCAERFVLLAQRSFKKKVKGIPYVSLVAGEALRRQHLADLVSEEVQKLLPLAGTGSCPHCRYPYPLPRERDYTRLEQMKDPMVGWAVLGAAAGLIVGLFIPWPALLFLVPSGGLIGTVVGALLGFQAPLHYAPAPRSKELGPDAFSLTEAEYDKALSTGFIWDMRRLKVPDEWVAEQGHLVMPLPLYDRTA